MTKHRTAGGPQVPQSKWKNNEAIAEAQRNKKSEFCSKCHAWHGQLGLEPTFQLYLNHMMMVCAEIKRVLKKTGSFWLNIGDTYSSTRWSTTPSTTGKSRPCSDVVLEKQVSLPSKCLLGIPWRLVLRLIDEEGWILRNAGIWNKPNSMPSSTKDRLSNSYEFLFHLVKNTEPQYYWNEKNALMVERKPKVLKENIDWEWKKCPKCEGVGKYENKACPRCKGIGKIKYSFWHSLGYWYDLDAIRKPYTEPLNRWGGPKTKLTDRSKGNEFAVQERVDRERRPNPSGKNPGDVWTIPTQPRKDLHFSTFPDKLCIKPILATCPSEICKKCGKARVRITKTNLVVDKKYIDKGKVREVKEAGDKRNVLPRSRTGLEGHNEYQTIGFTDCGCNVGFRPGILLDPFAGRGTALIMAKKLGRHYVGYELKKEYCEKLIKPALEEIDPLFKRRKNANTGSQ
ncbi:hypothetical protein ES703_73474 [subsurface metagenome]